MGKALVIYDSAYGNTEKIAKQITHTLDDAYQTKMLLVSDCRAADMQGIEFLVVGSPTQGGRPTQAIYEFLNQLPDNALRGVKVAAFDTRFAMNDHGLGLSLLMKTIGFAAERIATLLESKGGVQAISPEGFIVQDKSGPIKDGELERAAKWLEQVA